MDLEAMYARLTPEERAQLAQLVQSKMGCAATTSVDALKPTPQQMVALHTEVQQKKPGILAEIRKHPVVTAVIAGVAAFELDKHFGKA
jgi:hypothetical protein